jgi:hypothetical protein
MLPPTGCSRKMQLMEARLSERSGRYTCFINLDMADAILNHNRSSATGPGQGYVCSPTHAYFWIHASTLLST